jgi:predicted Zn-dependent protease
VQNVSRGQNFGFGVRVLYKGTWGFASSRSVTPEDVRRITQQAVEIARANAVYQRKRISLVPVELPGSSSAQAGLPAQKIVLVRNGVLENLTYSRFWAKQKGKEPTPGPVNSIMEGSQPPASMGDMIKSMDRGLLLGRFWYIRGVDPRTALQTGLTRDGIWYIENGKIQYPVKNFRFNQSIMQLLAPGNVDMIGKPERVGNSEGQGGNAALLPALKVKEFHLSSQSEAV